MLGLLITIVIIGLVVWLLSLLPLPAPFNQIILVVGVICAILAVVSFFFGGYQPLAGVHPMFAR